MKEIIGERYIECIDNKQVLKREPKKFFCILFFSFALSSLVSFINVLHSHAVLAHGNYYSNDPSLSCCFMMELTHHLLTQNLALAPTKTLASVIPSQHVKRQAQATSVVHITITAAGTVVYTQTATSYSYVASYSPVTGSDSTAYPTNNDTNNNNNNSSNQSGAGGSQTGGGGGTGGVNTGAIVGGVVGGVALIALIGNIDFVIIHYQPVSNGV